MDIIISFRAGTEAPPLLSGGFPRLSAISARHSYHGRDKHAPTTTDSMNIFPNTNNTNKHEFLFIILIIHISFRTTNYTNYTNFFLLFLLFTFLSKLQITQITRIPFYYSHYSHFFLNYELHEFLSHSLWEGPQPPKMLEKRTDLAFFYFFP